MFARKLKNTIAVGCAYLACALGLFLLGAILYTLLSKGLSAINWQMLTESMPGPGSEGGGLYNAIIGSLMMTVCTTILVTPIGLLAGTWLAEFGKGTKLREVIRFVNGILLSLPSILIGLFIYELIVIPSGHFSGWAGILSLTIIALPIIVTATEDMLQLLPGSLREAAAGLGIPRWRIICQIGYRAARSGLVTGVILAVARVSGETAPLLFTSLNNDFTSYSLNGPIASLPVTIYQYAMSPYQNWNDLAWGGALLLTMMVLILNIISRLLVAKKA
ncbi:phosphate ABC transporter permease PstA [Dongshaea marina]|uniref:phosphate ABC transporter permease PstA n=1 Tax=Dongshaea marina TaxID=2047966 RepID=UPI000D3E8B50|nr:phosphate ABC transporter permease PstA [Dongshaea marina]